MGSATGGRRYRPPRPAFPRIVIGWVHDEHEEIWPRRANGTLAAGKGETDTLFT